MCTVSLVSSRDGSALRLLMNRDERRLRAAAWPPAAVEIDGVSVIRPIDPQSGGTWIAMSDKGIVLALLNASGPAPSGGGRSRGTIIPALISSAGFEELAARWAGLDLSAVAPCTLVAATLNQTAVFVHPAPVRPGGVSAPSASGNLVTSSSLGDDLVRGPRQSLFAELMAQADEPWVAQTRFHQHAWPDRRHLSVLMSRPDACTVSRTEVVLKPERLDMRYGPIVDGWPAAISTGCLTMATARAVRAA